MLANSTEIFLTMTFLMLMTFLTMMMPCSIHAQGKSLESYLLFMIDMLKCVAS